jgi:HSP20 family molecular chaperone IbpA
MRLFEDLLDMQEETNRFFEDVYRRLALVEVALSRWEVADDRAFENEITRFLQPTGERRRIAVSSATTARDNRPTTVDIYDTSGDVVAEIAIPGLSPGDLMINVHGNRLTLQGRFSQTIELPPGLDGEQLRAQYRNGVLRLSLPKPTEPSKPIPIEFE